MKISSFKIIIAILCSSAVTSIAAQQDPNYTFYRFNMNLLNPAFAGATGATEFGFNVRSQWSGITGAPETQSAIFSTSVGNNVGLGLSVINDKTFIENQTSVFIDFSYKLKINDSNNLYFGLKGGFASYKANTDGLLTYAIQQDMSLMNIDGQFNPNFGAGVYLKNKNYFVAFSVPRILSPDRLQQNDGEARLGVDKTHMYLAGGYDFRLSEDVMLKPTVLTRYVEASPLSLDLTTILEFQERFGLGVGYRVDESASGIFMFNASWITIGYAYEIPLESPVSTIDNGTHELIMLLHL